MLSGGDADGDGLPFVVMGVVVLVGLLVNEIAPPSEHTLLWNGLRVKESMFDMVLLVFGGLSCL